MKSGCQGCKSDKVEFGIAMAFQPILDTETGRPFAYEALVRGSRGESAATVLAQITPENRYAFDQQCRVTAIEDAVAAGIMDTGAKLSINFLPNAVYSPLACIQLTLKTAQATNLPIERLIFEFTENEHMSDVAHVSNIVSEYRRMGFTTALDDFGAGYAGLSLLAHFQTDLIKLDMELLRDIDSSPVKQAIVRGLVAITSELGITLLAEGIETEAELAVLRALGIQLFQGYHFARPQVEAFQTFDQLGARTY